MLNIISMAKQKEILSELKRLDKKATEKFILEKKAKVSSLRFDLKSGKVKNIREIQQARRDIARANTILKIHA